MRSQSIVVIVS